MSQYCLRTTKCYDLYFMRSDSILSLNKKTHMLPNLIGYHIVATYPNQQKLVCTWYWGFTDHCNVWNSQSDTSYPLMLQDAKCCVHAAPHHGTAKSGLVAELNAIDGATRGDFHRRDTPGKMLGTQLPTSWLISPTHQGSYTMWKGYTAMWLKCVHHYYSISSCGPGKMASWSKIGFRMKTVGPCLWGGPRCHGYQAGKIEHIRNIFSCP